MLNEINFNANGLQNVEVLLLTDHKIHKNEHFYQALVGLENSEPLWAIVIKPLCDVLFSSSEKIQHLSTLKKKL